MRLVLTVFTLSVCCIIACCGESETLPFCLLNDERIEYGEDIGRRLDGCNYCQCDSEGFACTRMYCGPGQNCEIGGQQYNEFDIVPNDKCEECNCINGNLACYNCRD